MLILSRKRNERIIIDEKTSITILRVEGNKVHLGIAAPDDVTVYREEIYLKMQTLGSIF